MTKEIKDILQAFARVLQENRQAVLATVVHVEGSSYRRPGARMLVEDNGHMTGAISGGCLEGDAYRKAMLSMLEKKNKLIAYDSTDDDDITFGVQLGCNGIVYILFEPIDLQQTNNPIALLQATVEDRKDMVLGTGFTLKDLYGKQPGTFLLADKQRVVTTPDKEQLASGIAEKVALVLKEKKPAIVENQGSELHLLLDFIAPPIRLQLIGAGNDALPLVRLAAVMGWEVNVFDGRDTHANRQRFPGVHTIQVGKPEQVLPYIQLDERTYIILMTHNYNYDLAIMGLLLQKECRYIGALGPKKRLERLFEELERKGHQITDEQKQGIHGPIGIDIGAESPEEIALSIVAEVKAVDAGSKPLFLKEKQSGIHVRNVADLVRESPNSVPW